MERLVGRGTPGLVHRELRAFAGHLWGSAAKGFMYACLDL